MASPPFLFWRKVTISMAPNFVLMDSTFAEDTGVDSTFSLAPEGQAVSPWLAMTNETSRTAVQEKAKVARDPRKCSTEDCNKWSLKATRSTIPLCQLCLDKLAVEDDSE